MWLSLALSLSLVEGQLLLSTFNAIASRKTAPAPLLLGRDSNPELKQEFLYWPVSPLLTTSRARPKRLSPQDALSHESMNRLPL